MVSLNKGFKCKILPFVIRSDLKMASYLVARLIRDCPWLVYQYCHFLPMPLKLEILFYLKKSREVHYPESISYEFKLRRL